MIFTEPHSLCVTHLVQAHECVEGFSCRHGHLCVVFLQDQHVKHQLSTQKTVWAGVHLFTY